MYFITPAILRTYGLRIDAGITDDVLRRCIELAQLYAEKMLGQDCVSACKAVEATAPILVGGDVDGRLLLGLNKSIGYIAYALLLRDNVFLSVFGSVQKYDEYSRQADPQDIARMHYAEGEAGLRDVFNAYVAEAQPSPMPNFKPCNIPFLNELTY